MRALGDIAPTDAAPEVFGAVFAAKIMAMEATIKTLQTQILTLYNPTDKTKHIELNGKQGRIRSSNFVNSLQQRTGFNLESAGGKIEADLLNTWTLETRPAIMKSDYFNVVINWGLQTLRQFGGIRGIFQFWKDANGFGYFAKSIVDYDDNANIEKIAELKETSTKGVFQIDYYCRTADEVEIIKRARVFGYYSRNSKTINNMSIPNQWGMIIQDSPEKSAQISGLKVTLTFACKDNNSDSLEENPEWYATAFLIA